MLFLTTPAQGAGAPQSGPDDAFRSADANALDDLVADVRAAMADGALRTGEPFVTALALWSAVHGDAALWAASPGLLTPLARTVAQVAQGEHGRPADFAAARKCAYAERESRRAPVLSFCMLIFMLSLRS